MRRDILGALGSGYALMVLTIVVQFFLVPLYLHHLGKDIFGVLTMILAAINYGALGIGWASGGIARIFGELSAIDDIDGFADAYAFAKFVYMGYAAISIILFWGISPWMLAGALESPELLKALILASIYFLLMYEYGADRLSFVALCRQTVGNAIDAAGQLAFACSVVAGLYLDGGLVSVIASQIVSVMFARSLAWFYWRREGISLRWKWPLINPGATWHRISGKMGRHYVLYGALQLTLQADVLIVGWLAGPAIAAAYYLLWRVPEVCILLLGRIPSVFAPHFIQMDTRGDMERIRISYRKGLQVMLGLSALAGLSYAIAGNWFLHLWVGTNAPEGFIPYMLAGVALFFIAASQWPAGAAYALVKTGPLVKVTALQLALKLFLFALLFNTLDYLALLVAIILTHLFAVFFLYLKIGKDACMSPQTVASK